MSRPCHGFVTTCTRIKPLILLACHDVTTSRRGPGGKVFIGLQFVPRIHRKPRTRRTPIRAKPKLSKTIRSYPRQSEVNYFFRHPELSTPPLSVLFVCGMLKIFLPRMISYRLFPL